MVNQHTLQHAQLTHPTAALLVRHRAQHIAPHNSSSAHCAPLSLSLRRLGKIKEWTQKRDPQSRVIPFSVVFEAKITALGNDEAAKKALIAEKKVPSQLPKIITSGYHALDLIHYFTAGEDEVRGWTIKRGTGAPAAAGVIHTDFQKFFIAGEIMAFDDFKEAGSENACKAAGKCRSKGKDYIMVDGDIAFWKHNAGGAKKK